MKKWKFLLFLIFICLSTSVLLSSCGEEQVKDEDDDKDDSDDDDVTGDDDATGDDDDDDDDDDNDDDNDDDVVEDDYLATWPQSNIETKNYNETVAAGALRIKAEEYDDWHLQYHQPYHGGTVGAAFTDDSRTTVSQYFDWNDSCEWTGLYLGSQSMRYHVTGDPQAKINAIRVVNMLSGNLHITETPGFIARYWAEQDPLIYPSDAWCDDPSQARCHRIESGPFAGNWWWGETSRDMYNGWFFGMCLAFDLVDDEDMRDIIRDDVTHVLTVLKDQDWTILNEIGQPTDSAPDVMAPFRFAWLVIGYHITGNETIKEELKKLLLNENRIVLRLTSINFMNKYTQYFGSCLSHEYWYNLLRLGKVYFSENDYNFLVNLFETQGHTYTRLSHNPWFNGVFMSQGDYTPEKGADPYQDQLEEDLVDFPDAPNVRYYLSARDPYTYTLDPVSVFLHDLLADYPFLQQIMGNVNYQAEEAFPVNLQCTTDFLFQRNPFKIEECGNDDPKVVNPGVDYLIPYWLATYHKFISKDM